MSDGAADGVVYTEFRRLTADTPLLSLWSYHSARRETGRRTVQATADGRHEYWLDRGDPLLNTILPGTPISVVINLGDVWATGPAMRTAERVPALSVVGPCTQARALWIGTRVHAFGAVLPATFAETAFGCQASELVDRIVALDDLWERWRIERLLQGIGGHGDTLAAAGVRDELLDATAVGPRDAVVSRTSRLLTVRGGRASIRDLAVAHGVSQQTLARRFGVATGLAPKHFARISRFQALVHTLLLTDVAQWAGIAPGLGFYDQAHMINEFRAFAGESPTTFFQPRGQACRRQSSGLRGRPSEWERPLDTRQHV